MSALPGVTYAVWHPRFNLSGCVQVGCGSQINGRGAVKGVGISKAAWCRKRRTLMLAPLRPAEVGSAAIRTSLESLSND